VNEFTPAYRDESVTVYEGDCLDVMRGMPDCSVDSVVTDPPYSYAFMGKNWDSHESPRAFQAWCESWARECLRVLKPGGFLAAFGGTRTFHRLACGVEDAGFEVRDSIGHGSSLLAWVQGQGFPKSRDVGKAIDRARDDSAAITAVTSAMADAADRAGITRAELDAHMGTSDMGGWWLSRLPHRSACPRWDQWLVIKDYLRMSDDLDAEVWRLNGRKGKPGDNWDSREVIGVRTTGIGTGGGAVPYIADSENRDVTAPATPEAKQWAGFGTALRPSWEPIVVARKPIRGTVASNVVTWGTGALNIDACRVAGERVSTTRTTALGVMNDDGWVPTPAVFESHPAGRWPANVVLDESAAAELDRQSGVTTSGALRPYKEQHTVASSYRMDRDKTYTSDANSGGASRFFPVFKYEPKAPTAERPKLPDGTAHPTVKPRDLIAWLARLFTPPGGLILDPFAGTGTTGEAAVMEGFRAVLIERDPKSVEMIRVRLRRPIQAAMFGA